MFDEKDILPETPQSEPQEETWQPGQEDQMPPELAQMQAIQKEAEQPKEEIKPEPLVQPKQSKSPQESFAELKAKALRIERERDDAMRKLQEMEAKRTQVPAQDEEDLSFNIEPDEIAEGKHISKVQKKLYRLEQQLKESERRNAEIAMEARLKAQYPDFDNVVSSRSLEMLKEHDPESAMIVESIPNLYTKAVAAYKAIKGMNKIQYEQDTYAAEREKAQRNAAKPRPAVSISPQTAESPLSRVNAFAEGLTPDLEKQLRKEMAEAIRNR